MLRIGYVRLHDEQSADDTVSLKAHGCHVVRAEEPANVAGEEQSVLGSVLDFIGDGDQLVVTSLQHLGHSTRAVLDVIERLESRGASLLVLKPQIASTGEGGRALKAALHAVAAVEPPWIGRRRRGAPAVEEIQALQQAGVGPVEIARRLGVSRMTVWRKLRTLDA